MSLKYYLIISVTMSISLADCPRTCECKWKSGKESVICSNSNFTNIPPNLDSGTQILDLTGNVISTLNNQEFSRQGLVNLQKLHLIKCKLKTIEKYAFERLINLIELDLSFNLLVAIPSNSFESIPELRELRLNGNPIQQIFHDSFSKLPQLVRLEMAACKLFHIETKSFRSQESSLEWLKLDNNKLVEVDSSVFVNLQNLHGLELAGNPWNCTCKLSTLREWMLKRNVPYDIPPVCRSPKRLQNKSWKLLDLDEFACPPKISAKETKSKGIEGGNATITCQIEGIPLPTVKWTLRNKIINGNFSKKSIIVKQNNNSSELVIQNADFQDAGIYTCSAENKAGKSEALVTLTISKRPLETFSTKALVISAFLGVTVTISCCLLAACLVTVQKRRSKWHNNARRDDNTYEKIELKPKVMHRNLNGDVSREETVVVNSANRKNGDYSVVPGNDTENEDEEESTLEISTPGTSNGKKWTNESVKNGGEQESRDNNTSSTCGTYRQALPEMQTVATAPWKVHDSVAATPPIRQVPDVIGHSSFSGSAGDVSDLFCTLPRKKEGKRYKSNDSQAALLPDSRYGSDSSFSRRLSIEMQRYPPPMRRGPNNNNNNNNCKQPSASLLNLSKESANLNATPLLDVRGLENRFVPHPANSYDYHAAQLEKFLEEYRALQKQLTKMKETCDSLCQEQTDPVRTGADLNNPVKSPISGSIQDSVDFKNFENELTKYLMARGGTTTKNFDLNN